MSIAAYNCPFGVPASNEDLKNRTEQSARKLLNTIFVMQSVVDLHNQLYVELKVPAPITIIGVLS